MKLKMKNGSLEYATKEDVERLANWWADGRVMEHAGFPKGLRTNKENLAKRLEKQAIDSVLWMIKDSQQHPIGEMNHTIKDGVATLGIKICDLKSQNKGMGKTALKTLIRYLFQTFKIDRMWLDTMIENKRAQHVYQSLHFKQTKINKAHWKDQLGNMRTSVEFELSRKTFLRNEGFFND